MASQQSLIGERTDANVKLGERGRASKGALPGISFLYTLILFLPPFYARTPIVEVLTSLHNTLMVVVAPRSVFTFESVLECPVLKRLLRVLRDRSEGYATTRGHATLPRPPHTVALGVAGARTGANAKTRRAGSIDKTAPGTGSLGPRCGAEQLTMEVLLSGDSVEFKFKRNGSTFRFGHLRAEFGHGQQHVHQVLTCRCSLIARTYVHLSTSAYTAV